MRANVPARERVMVKVVMTAHHNNVRIIGPDRSVQLCPVYDLTASVRRYVRPNTLSYFWAVATRDGRWQLREFIPDPLNGFAQ